MRFGAHSEALKSTSCAAPSSNVHSSAALSKNLSVKPIVTFVRPAPSSRAGITPCATSD